MTPRRIKHCATVAYIQIVKEVSVVKSVAKRAVEAFEAIQKAVTYQVPANLEAAKGQLQLVNAIARDAIVEINKQEGVK